jgi:hypothetical protein
MNRGSKMAVSTYYPQNSMKELITKFNEKTQKVFPFIVSRYTLVRIIHIPVMCGLVGGRESTRQPWMLRSSARLGEV